MSRDASIERLLASRHRAVWGFRGKEKERAVMGILGLSGLDSGVCGLLDCKLSGCFNGLLDCRLSGCFNGLLDGRLSGCFNSFKAFRILRCGT